MPLNRTPSCVDPGSEMPRTGVIYILASQRNGTLYTGVTSDLPARLEQHRTDRGSKFAGRYGALRLVWYEEHDEIAYAIVRKKTIRKWPRAWKVNAIDALNPEWSDLTAHRVLGHG